MTVGQGIFLLHATDPASPWSDAIWLAHEAFDPLLFFDADGTCYSTRPTLGLSHRVMHPVQSLGHAELVDDPGGKWWALCLGTRHQGRHHLLGRETVLMSVTLHEG